jgi:hypothetical protein
MADGTELARASSGTSQGLLDEALEARDALTSEVDDEQPDAEEGEFDPVGEENDDEPSSETDDDEIEDDKKLNVVPKKYRLEYKARGDATCCGDDFSAIFRAVTTVDKQTDILALIRIGELNNIDVNAKWGTRNVGMRRMNLGNMLRSRLKKNGEISWPNEAGKLTAAQAGIMMESVKEEKEAA